MASAPLGYFEDLTETTGGAWNKFWFTPIDPLPICGLRVFIGLLALAYVLSFTFDLVSWFGPNGLMPGEAVLSLNSSENRRDGDADVVTRFRLSYFYFTDSPAQLWTLHFLGCAVVAAFTAGLFSRVTSIGTLIVVLAYINRAPMIAGHFEPLLAMTLFYLCFAPVGAYLSLDRWLQARKRNDSTATLPAPSLGASVSLRLIQVHLAMFCLMMGLTKLAGQTWWNGEAIWVLGAQVESRLFDISSMRRSTFLLNGWAHLVVAFELIFPLLIWNRLARPILLILAVFVWGSLLLVTGLIGFYVILLVSSLAFVPESTWRRFLKLPNLPEPSAA